MQEEIRMNDHVKEATKNEGINVRKSTRTQKKRMVITEDEIGDCDNKDDPDYHICTKDDILFNNVVRL